MDWFNLFDFIIIIIISLLVYLFSVFVLYITNDFNLVNFLKHAVEMLFLFKYFFVSFQIDCLLTSSTNIYWRKHTLERLN